MSSQPAARILKRELRKQIRASLSSLPASQIAQESQEAISKFIQTPLYESAQTIAIYSSMRNEFDTSTLLSDAFSRQKRVFLPRVASKTLHQMLFLHVDSLSELATFPQNSWGIREPPLQARRMQAPRDCALDLIVVPGLAFDLQGRRCGHGMGYYDTLLSEYAHSGRKMPALVALTLRVQIVPQVPVVEHDWKVDHVMFAGDD